MDSGIIKSSSFWGYVAHRWTIKYEKKIKLEMRGKA